MDVIVPLSTQGGRARALQSAAENRDSIRKMKPGALFKFIEPQFVQQALELGAVRLGTFEDFRKMDESDGIGDADEGISVGKLDGTIDGLPEADRIRILRDSGFGGSDEALARMREVTFSNSGRRSRAPPAYILCFSMSIEATGLPEAKSAILEVTDIQEFAAALAQAHPDRLSGRGTHGPVVYDAAAHDIIALPMPPPNPLSKRKAFEGQREYRVVFEPTGGSVCEPFVTRAPLAAKFLKRIR